MLRSDRISLLRREGLSCGGGEYFVPEMAKAEWVGRPPKSSRSGISFSLSSATLEVLFLLAKAFANSCKTLARRHEVHTKA